jgi:hypothetical protein
MRGNYYSTHKQDNTLSYTTHLNHEYQVRGPKIRLVSRWNKNKNKSGTLILGKTDLVQFEEYK